MEVVLAVLRALDRSDLTFTVLSQRSISGDLDVWRCLTIFSPRIWIFELLQLFCAAHCERFPCPFPRSYLGIGVLNFLCQSTVYVP